jgi:hypothetical protein
MHPGGDGLVAIEEALTGIKQASKALERQDRA